MRRSRQNSISSKPSEWEAITARAKAWDMPVSRFITGCAHVENDDQRPGLPEDELRALVDGVERIAAGVGALLAPLPGSGTTLREALAFLHQEAQSQQTNRKHAVPLSPNKFEQKESRGVVKPAV